MLNVNFFLYFSPMLLDLQPNKWYRIATHKPPWGAVSIIQTKWQATYMPIYAWGVTRVNPHVST